MGALSDIVSRALCPDKIIGGYFRLISRLGQGGFGEVWKAQDNRSGDIIAVKLPQHQFAINPKVIASLERECATLKTLSHPNICRLIDLIHDPVYGPLLITDFVDGTDLKTATENLGWDEQLSLFIQALQGLDYLHGLPKPVMHLDIKPPNILVSNGRLKLIDFGISGFKPPANTVGTYSYMSPEMIIDSNSVTTCADLYSLGVVIYQCLTGVQPFRSESAEKTKQLQKEMNPDPPSKLNIELPPWMDTLVKGLLNKDPNLRYASAQEVLRELRLLRGLPADNTAHRQSFAAASGSFIGRQDILQAVQSECMKTGQGDFFFHIIRGVTGNGKTRILKEIKFNAQLDKLQTVVISSAAEATAERLAPVTEALTTSTPPVLIVLDDYDLWCADAPNLLTLFDTIRTHPGLPTRIGCVMSMTQVSNQWSTSDVHIHDLAFFTVQEVADYINAVAKIPEPRRTPMADELWKYTQGSPDRLAAAMTRLVAQGYFASGEGQWDASMFEDVTIEVTESQEDETKNPHSTDIPKFLVETAESALARGKVQGALAVMDRFPDCKDGLVLLWRGILLTAINETDAANGVLSEALQIAESAHDRVLALRIRNQMARVLFKKGKHEDAMTVYRQSESDEASLNESDRASILNNELGYLLMQAGCFIEAEPSLRKLIARAERAGNMRRSALSQAQLGDCLMHIPGRLEESRKMLLLAVQQARLAQQHDVLSYAYNQLANSYVIENEQEKAVEILKRAIPLNYFLNDLRAVAMNMTNYGLGLIRNGNYTEARHKLSVAHAYIQKSDDLTRACMPPCLVGQSEICKSEGELKEASTLLDQAEKIAHRYNVWKENAFAILMTRAEIRRAEGHVPFTKELVAKAGPFAKTSAEKREWDAFMRLL